MRQLTGRQVQDNITGKIIWGKSKTAIMCIPLGGSKYEDADMTKVFDDEKGLYGLTPELSSTADVDKRLASAAAFGDLNQQARLYYHKIYWVNFFSCVKQVTQ